MHSPIIINSLSIEFLNKICFSNFSTNVYYGSKIAIIGRNGSGKSSLIKAIAGMHNQYEGIIKKPDNIRLQYIPQIILDNNNLSGGERFEKALDNAINFQPNILLLDEPTNHLDFKNRQKLFYVIEKFNGTLIIASHDTQLLNNYVNTLWHIDNEDVYTFSGNYSNYIKNKNQQKKSIESELKILSLQKKETHNKLMQEQQRASKSKAYGEKKYKDDKLALRCAQARGEQSHNKKKAKIRGTKEDLLDQLADLRLPETIIPKFHLNTTQTSEKIILQISEGFAGYSDNNLFLKNINLTLSGNSKLAITGKNGCGKTTLLNAIMDDENIIKTGNWNIPKKSEINYLDQHYNNLNENLSVFETIDELNLNWNNAQIRKHLNDFLFRKNEEINNLVKNLSGGEKARLSLAKIAAKTPKLLILDEPTNNIDLETKEHLISILSEYPSALIVISHDADFLKAINIENFYNL